MLKICQIVPEENEFDFRENCLKMSFLSFQLIKNVIQEPNPVERKYFKTIFWRCLSDEALIEDRILVGKLLNIEKNNLQFVVFIISGSSGNSGADQREGITNITLSSGRINQIKNLRRNIQPNVMHGIDFEIWKTFY